MIRPTLGANRQFFGPAAMLAILALVAFTLNSLPAQAETSASGTGSAGVAAQGRYGTMADLAESARASSEATPMANSGTIKAGKCKYQQRTDDVHVSKTKVDASVHAWWAKVSGTCPSKANVDGQLQAVFCDALASCYWRTVDSDSKNLAPGGGTGKWVPLNENCASNKKTGWRSRVDVDLIDVSDPGGWTRSAGKDLPCYPAS